MPDTSTEVALATTTLGSAASTITFDSIGAGYTDLRLVLNGSLTASLQISLRFNNISTTTYSITNLNGDGATASSSRGSNQTEMNFNYGFNATTAQPILATADIFSYAGSTNKTTLLTFQQDRNGSGFVERNVGLWRSTSAITRLDIITSTSTLAAGFTATLYGILKA